MSKWVRLYLNIGIEQRVKFRDAVIVTIALLSSSLTIKKEYCEAIKISIKLEYPFNLFYIYCTIKSELIFFKQLLSAHPEFACYLTTQKTNKVISYKNKPFWKSFLDVYVADFSQFIEVKSNIFLN